jgi:hypothetical protein
MFDSSRRQFLLSASTVAATALLPAPLRAVAMESVSPKDGATLGAKRLDTGWQFRRGPLYGIWDIWRGRRTISGQE